MTNNRLLADASVWLEEHGYTKSTAYVNYIHFWNGFVKSTGMQSVYSKAIADVYVVKKYGRDIMRENPSILPPREYRVYRAFQALQEYHTTYSISGTSMAGASVRQALPEYENSILECYMQSICGLDYSAKSKRYAYGIVHHYLFYSPLSTISDAQVLEYFTKIVGCSKQTMKSRLKVLKRFHMFCLEKGYLDIDYSVLFPSAKTRRNTEIPSVYTPGELAMLLDYLKNNHQNRKRNYAIAMLAAVYGFRSGDIVDMSLEDIDWDSGTIRIIQSKTKNVLEHRLIPQTGNAVVDYLLGERPDSPDQHVFLKNDGQALVSTSVSAMIFNAYNRSGIVTAGRKHGSHSLRHSLASNLLAADTGILEISKTLGHSSVDTTRNFYAKVDIGHLRLCGLEAPVDGK